MLLRFAWHGIFEAVVLTAGQEDELKKTPAAVESAGAEPLTYPLDLREPKKASRMECKSRALCRAR